MTYSVVVRNPNTWTITDGRRVFEEINRCNHEHQTVASAAACLKEFTARCDHRPQPPAL